jgi:hypothetical protein
LGCFVHEQESHCDGWLLFGGNPAQPSGRGLAASNHAVAMPVPAFSGFQGSHLLYYNDMRHAHRKRMSATVIILAHNGAVVKKFCFGWRKIENFAAERLTTEK